jgi:amidase
MRVDEYVSHDAVGIVELIETGEVSALEVTDAALAALKAVNPTLNAVVEVYDDARDVTKSRPGPFHGVPYLTKDVGRHFKGRKAESGSRLCEGSIVETNDYFAELVYESGVNLIGRSNVPEFSMALCADNLLYGATSNPWRKGYSTSGSSGGAAAAVAAGIVPIAHASDMGGSTRGPAAWCGTVGLQPSRGRISVGPGEDEHGFGMAQAFCVTRSMRDTARMLDCLGKPMPGDPFVIARPSGPYVNCLKPSGRRFRIGWSADPLMDAPLDPEVARAVAETAHLLAQLGYDVEEAQPLIDLPGMDECCKHLWYFGFDAYLDKLGALAGRKVGPDTVGKATLKFYEFAKRQTADDFFRSMADLNRMRRDMSQFFVRYDVWLSPTCAQVAQPNGVFGMNIDIDPEEFLIHEQRQCQFMVPYNVAGQPALSLPLAMHPNGLPIGIQIGARHAEEHLLIEIGSKLEEAMPWRHRRPPLHATGSRV